MKRINDILFLLLFCFAAALSLPHAEAHAALLHLDRQHVSMKPASIHKLHELSHCRIISKHTGHSKPGDHAKHPSDPTSIHHARHFIAINFRGLEEYAYHPTFSFHNPLIYTSGIHPFDFTSRIFHPPT